jgi:hypothetical protein
MTKYVDPVPKPCSDCPFRRKAMPGWLGASSPEGFIDCMERDEPLPCHQTIDYDNNPHWLVEWMHQKTGNMCAGALIFMANKIQQHPFQKMAKDHENVFSNTIEFVRYHREAGVHSWDEDDQTEGAKMRRQLISESAKRMGQPIVDFKERRTKPKKRSPRSTKR